MHGSRAPSWLAHILLCWLLVKTAWVSVCTPTTRIVHDKTVILPSNQDENGGIGYVGLENLAPGHNHDDLWMFLPRVVHMSHL